MTHQAKKGETKNQHYVPQFYQRYFSVDLKNIGTYVISQDKNIPCAPIKSQASGNYFYSENMKIEHALSAIEGLAKEVIDKIITNPKGHLTDEDQYTLYVFVMLQAGRTQARVNLCHEHTKRVLPKIIQNFCELLHNKDEKHELTEIPEEMLHQMSFSLTQPGLFALGTQAQLIDLCIDLDYKILINQTQFPFITSDHPVAMYDQFLERMEDATYAIGSRGLQFYLPLTPFLGVMYYDPKCYKIGDKKKKYIEIIQKKDIYELNKLTAANAENVIYYKPSSITEYILKGFADKNRQFHMSEHIETLPEFKTSTGGSIVIQRYKAMFCNLTLSFVKELPNYKSIQPQNYNRNIHRLRDIVYYKDTIIKR